MSLLPLWAFMACSRVTFTFNLYDRFCSAELRVGDGLRNEQVRAVKAYGGWEVCLQSFLTLALDGGHSVPRRSFHKLGGYVPFE
jgi:hypothetical protein